MPQMSPMSWTILFFMFTMLFLFFNVLNYFNFIPTFKPSEMKNKALNNDSTLIWKW